MTSYVVSAGRGVEPSDVRVRSAQAALQVYVARLRERGRPAVLDEAGQPVALTSLLAEATWQAGDPDARNRLTETLADYVDASLRIAGNGIGPPGEGARWRLAGRAWAEAFNDGPSLEVLAAVQRRHPRHHSDELRRGAWEVLPHYLAIAMPTRGQWGVYDSVSGDVRQVYGVEDVARAHADALNSGRSWSDEDRDRITTLAMIHQRARRAAERARHARTAPASPPAPSVQNGHRPGRRP